MAGCITADVIHRGMVQPKTPPLSVRLGDARLAAVDAYAAKHGLKRHAALLDLVDHALAVGGRIIVKGAGGGPYPEAVRAPHRFGANKATAPFLGLTASGEALPPRKAQPKGGKKP